MTNFFIGANDYKLTDLSVLITAYIIYNCTITLSVTQADLHKHNLFVYKKLNYIEFLKPSNYEKIFS